MEWLSISLVKNFGCLKRISNIFMAEGFLHREARNRFRAIHCTPQLHVRSYSTISGCHPRLCVFTGHVSLRGAVSIPPHEVYIYAAKDLVRSGLQFWTQAILPYQGVCQWVFNCRIWKVIRLYFQPVFIGCFVKIFSNTECYGTSGLPVYMFSWVVLVGVI